MKIILKKLELADVNKVMKWINDPEIVKNFANFDHIISRKEERKFIKNLINSKNDKVFSIFTEDRGYIGQTGLQIHWPSKVGRLALIIGDKSKWGKGYAQETLREIVKIAFEKLQLHKVFVITFKENERMQHIMEKFGFKKEGLLKEEYYNKGKYYDIIRFSLLEKEYFAGKEKIK